MEGENNLVPALFNVTWNSGRSGKRIALPELTDIAVGDQFKCHIIQNSGRPLKLIYTRVKSGLKAEENKGEITESVRRVISELDKELEEEKYKELTELSEDDILNSEKTHIKKIEDDYSNDKFYDMEGT